MQTKEILSLANYVYKNYPAIRDKVEFWQLLSLLDRNEDKIVFIKEGNEFRGAAFYLRLCDDNFLKVIMGEYDLSNPEHIHYLLTDKGDNIHFIYCVGSMRPILKGLRKMIKYEKPMSVSWFKPDMEKIHIVQFERKDSVCLQ